MKGQVRLHRRASVSSLCDPDPHSPVSQSDELILTYFPTRCAYLDFDTNSGSLWGSES